MTRTRVLFAAAAFAFLAGSISRDAHALGPIDLEVGAKAGGGTNPFSGQTPSTINPLGFGLGGRAGVAFFGIYAGVDLMYYFGGSQTEPIGGVGGVSQQNVSVSEHTLMYGVDLGYNFKISILTIRPQLGLGNFTLTSSGGGQSTSVNNLYLEPGVTGLVSLGTLFVGADANLLVLPGIPQPDGGKGTNTAFTLHGQVGVRF
jgi:hypothetical protein